MSGDKIKSYGGNITLEQSGVGSGQSIKSSTAIMTGNRLTLHYIREQRDDSMTKILLTEKDWVKLEFGVPTPATKEDLMKVLSDIQVIEDWKRFKMLLPIKVIHNSVFVPEKFESLCRFFTYELQPKQK